MTAQLQTQKQSQKSDLVQSQQNKAVGGGVAGVSNAQKTQASSHFSDAEIKAIKGWYAKKNYATSFIKEFQRVVGTKDDGDVGKLTINAVYDWQVREHLTPLDGKFGGGCAEHAGLTIKTNNGSGSGSAGGGSAGSQTQTQTPEVTSGGSRPRPTRYAQGNYKKSPYVVKKYYDQMKEAMGDTPYALWDKDDKKINSIYNAAYSYNGGATTISSSGCGIVSFGSMRGWDPKRAAEYGMQNGSRRKGGLNREFYKNNGGTAAASAQAGLTEVAKGKFMIACMTNARNNYWTTQSHFVLVYDYDGTYVYTCDSGSRDRQKSKKIDFTGAFNDGYVFSR